VQYTSHATVASSETDEIDNDETLQKLAEVAVSHAALGLTWWHRRHDRRTGQNIRQALDDNGFKDAAVMAYAAKHASSFFGPFREAAFSTPKFGDRRTYQMDYSNPEEALREIGLDIKEGADMIMVKPALAYLDIIIVRRRDSGCRLQPTM